MSAVVASLVVAAALLAAVTAGPAVLALVVVVLGVGAVVDGARILARHGARPVVPAALLPVVALPTLAAGDPAIAWTRVGSWYAATFLLASALMLLFGRRTRAALSLGGTMAVAGLVGLGAVALVLLAGLPGGFRWVVVVVLLAAAADLADRLARLLLGRRGASSRRADRLAAVATVAAMAFMGSAVVTAASELLVPTTAAVLVVLALLAARASAALWPGVRLADGAVDPLGLRPGGLLAATGTMLLTAPAAYLVVRATGL